jgi:hypothetical protein
METDFNTRGARMLNSMSDQTPEAPPAAPDSPPSAAGRMPGVLLDVAGVLAAVIVVAVVADVLTEGKLSRKVRSLLRRGGATDDD